MAGKVIALVGCVKSKLAGRHQAKDLFDSVLFKYSRAYAEANSDIWFVLDAKNGIVSPEEPIDSYEGTLMGKTPMAKQEWARRVHKKMQEMGLDDPENTVLWIAGRDCKEPLAYMLICKQRDPMAGMMMAPRIAWLKSHTTEQTLK
jgi:hypothetical protein